MHPPASEEQIGKNPVNDYAVAYAYAEFDSPSEQHVELRCSADDNLSVWLNGKKMFAREQWLNAARLDRFVTPVVLASGKNRVLVKICQGPQPRDPEIPNNWSFQLRFCDSEGVGVKVSQSSPPAVGTAAVEASQ